MMMEVTPHLKSVLKNYQHSATKSLQGPGVALVAPKTEAPSPDPKEDGDFFQPPPFPPVQQLPILTTADTSCSERTETTLEGEAISCFVVGGERRLCLPQILNSVLRDFSLMQINQECDRLQIYCSRCTPEQLNVLKSQAILPCSAPSCGLITKTDAERLCSALLHVQSPPQPLRPRKGAFAFSVLHRCFGKCRGLCIPDLYTSRDARCIECSDCNASFTPQQFVCHMHRNLENRTVHWGFDSTNWRVYLQVPEDQEEREKCLRCLDEMGERFEGKVPFPPPLLPTVKNNLKRKEIKIDEEIVKEEHDLSPIKDDPDPPPLKKNKIEEYFSHLPYNIQLQQIYAAVDPLYLQIMHDLTAASSNHRHHLSAFKPVPPCLKETRLRQTLGRYGDPPVLQNPERVVPLSDSERFERSFQPNVALAPPLLKKHRYFCRDRKDEVSSSSRESAIKSPVKIKQEKSDEPHSTVSVVQSTARYNSEIELSTDTDDSASETTEKGSDLAKIEEALKAVEDDVRVRVLELVRNMAKEHEALTREKDNKIGELEGRIAELEKKVSGMVNGNAREEEEEEGEEEEENASSSRIVDEEVEVVIKEEAPQQTSVIASVEQKAIVLTAE